MRQNIKKNHSPPSWAFKVLPTVNQDLSPKGYNIDYTLLSFYKYRLCLDKHKGLRLLNDKLHYSNEFNKKNNLDRDEKHSVHEVMFLICFVLLLRM